MLMNKGDVSAHIAPPTGGFEQQRQSNENQRYNFSGPLSVWESVCLCITHTQTHSYGSNNSC